MSEPKELDDLKPCPFCGSKNLACVYGIEVDSIECRDCAAEGPYYGKSDKARDGWNQRPAEAELAALRAENEALRRERDETIDVIERLVGLMPRWTNPTGVKEDPCGAYAWLERNKQTQRNKAMSKTEIDRLLEDLQQERKSAEGDKERGRYVLPVAMELIGLLRAECYRLEGDVEEGGKELTALRAKLEAAEKALSNECEKNARMLREFVGEEAAQPYPTSAPDYRGDR